MKKTYISPAQRVISIDCEELIAQSVKAPESLPGTSFGGKTSIWDIAQKEADVRAYIDWEEDEDW